MRKFINIVLMLAAAFFAGTANKKQSKQSKKPAEVSDAADSYT